LVMPEKLMAEHILQWFCDQRTWS